MKNLRENKRRVPREGFTLIEMLVVLVIMSSLIGIGASVMKNATTAQGVDTGAAVAEGVFSEARALAKSQGLPTRVVIYKGGGKGELREKHLRYMGVVRTVMNADGSNGGWMNQLSTRGVNLPKNVFFNAKLSGSPQEMSVQIPGAAGAQACYYYEFNGEGILVNPKPPANQSSAFVVQTGRLYPTEDTPKVERTGSREVGGFAIWKRGNTSLFRDPQQIPGVGTGNPTF